MRASEYLKAARAVIDRPEKWTKHAMARDANRHSVPVSQPDAVRFCSVGALEKTILARNGVSGTVDEEARILLTLAVGVLTNSTNSVVWFNDSRRTKHEDVMQVFDAAIQFAKAGEAA